MMKKVALTAAAVLALGMTAAACGDDDDDTPATDAPGVGAVVTDAVADVTDAVSDATTPDDGTG
ncbi:hypothetical protein BH24ACT5_BH24ACT5_29260 [soil metagenome]